MTDYRAIAMSMTKPEHAADVEAIARHLHANESLHLHDCIEGTDPCSYCWLRAAKAVQAIERADRRIDSSKNHDELRDKRTDLLNIRGILSPQGRSLSLGPVVPMPLGDEVAPAVEWLAAEVERLQAGITDAISDGSRADEAHDAMTAAIDPADYDDGKDIDGMFGEDL